MGRNKKNRNRDRNNNIEYQEKDYSKYYLWIVKAGIITCLFLPLLIVHSHLFAMQVGKTLVFRTIIEIITFFYILLIFKKPEYRPKWGLFEISITLFIFIYFLTSLTGANFLRSFWGTAERMGGFFTMLHFWAYFLILISVFKTKKEWKTLFGVSIFVALLSSLYGLGQSVFFWRTIMPWIELKDIGIYNEIIKYVTPDNFVMVDNYRPFGTIGNAGLFTAYILYNLFFGIYLSASNRNILKKVISFILSSMILAILIIAGSRSSSLAVIGGLFTVALVYLMTSGKKRVKGFSILLILFLVLGSGYIFLNKKEDWVNNNYILARFVNISLDSDESRTMTWESSWTGSMDSPILGVGPENYNIVFNKYFNPLHFGGYGYVTWYDKAHNIFLDILTTMGVVGLLSYMSNFVIIYCFLIKNRRKARENLPAFALIASFPVAYFVQNMFWFDDFSSYLMLFLFFAFVSNFFNEELLFEYNIEKGKKMMDKMIKISDIRNIGYWIADNKSIFMAITGIVLVSMIYYTNIKAWKFHDLTTITVAAFSKNADDSFLWYKKAMANSTYLGRQEIYKRLGNYANAKYAISGNENPKEKEVFKQNLKFAISEMENAVAENKEDVQFYSLLGALYNKYYSNFREEEYIKKAEKTLQKAVELSPERETVYYEYGQTMVFKKDYDKAIEFFKKGIELNPPVAVSHWYLGLTYLNAKEYNLADAEITEAIKLGYGYKTTSDILNIVPIYIELKDYSRVEKLYLDILDLDPNRPEIYASLALTYKELGNKQKAIEMAKKAISLDESYGDEAERFIAELEK